MTPQRTSAREAGAPVLSYSSSRSIGVPAAPRFRTIQVYPKDLPILVRQADVRESDRTRPSAAVVILAGHWRKRRNPLQKEADNGRF
jgi:hypothetical protein